MLKKYIDKDNKFYELFDYNTGFYVRSGMLEDGKDTGVDPFMRNFPGLIDVGIMGHCTHGLSGFCRETGMQCYQSGLSENRENMSLENFKNIVDQCKGKVFQFALGGRGDVDQHEKCENILAYCKENEIVPNFTTSGYGLTHRVANMLDKYVGAVAVSWYRTEYTNRAIEMLINAGIKTNIHYVLGNNTIEEAINKLNDDSFPEGINAVIFLLHKPKGLGTVENTLKSTSTHVQRFFELVDRKRFKFKIGFDSCSCAGIINFTSNINFDSVDYCEGARFSCYIDALMNMMPCSFALGDKKWQVSLNHFSIKEAWNSNVFTGFRNLLANACSKCNCRQYCGGGCPLYPEVTLCIRTERTTNINKTKNDFYKVG